VKENIIQTPRYFLHDTDESSIMRSNEHYLQMFSDAGYDVLQHFENPNFEEFRLYQIFCFVLRPK
jgi:hypothetical protein